MEKARKRETIKLLAMEKKFLADWNKSERCSVHPMYYLTLNGSVRRGRGG
jgi:hypothetical protein